MCQVEGGTKSSSFDCTLPLSPWRGSSPPQSSSIAFPRSPQTKLVRHLTTYLIKRINPLHILSLKIHWFVGKRQMKWKQTWNRWHAGAFNVKISPGVHSTVASYICMQSTVWVRYNAPYCRGLRKPNFHCTKNTRPTHTHSYLKFTASYPLLPDFYEFLTFNLRVYLKPILRPNC